MVSQSRFAAAEVFRVNAAAAKFGQLKETLPILAIPAVNFLLFSGFDCPHNSLHLNENPFVIQQGFCSEFNVHIKIYKQSEASQTIHRHFALLLIPYLLFVCVIALQLFKRR